MKSELLSQMLAKAQQAQKHAYAPYSKFYVGTCLRTEHNQLFAGCNTENASYSLTQCAEANAIGAMITAGETRIVEVIIVASHPKPCTPCGACRQRLREFAAPTTLIHMYSSSGAMLTKTLDELLPLSFGPDYL